jgi:hypothetical protein
MTPVVERMQGRNLLMPWAMAVMVVHQAFSVCTYLVLRSKDASNLVNSIYILSKNITTVDSITNMRDTNGES